MQPRRTASSDPHRFEFGANWRRFLRVLNADRIAEAERSLCGMLRVDSLAGLQFLDIGSGSGLFSLAARRLGAEVVSFDYDPQSVECTRELKRRYLPDDTSWTILNGSVLDSGFMDSLGTFDVVYSWGVLHHTGDMWRAIREAAKRTRRGGLLFIAIYNDQGARSVWWTRIKRTYNRLPRPLRFLYVMAFATALECAAVAVALARLDPARVVHRWTSYHSARGMSRWHDLVDWIGGYPFQVAEPGEVFEHCRELGFRLLTLKTCGGRMGCNEFVFSREP